MADRSPHFSARVNTEAVGHIQHFVTCLAVRRLMSLLLYWTFGFWIAEDRKNLRAYYLHHMKYFVVEYSGAFGTQQVVSVSIRVAALE
jgi:hypothetical protein